MWGLTAYSRELVVGRLVAAIGSFVLVLALFAITPAAQAEGAATISGSAGQSGVAVTVYPAGSDDPVASITTPSGGAFSISGLEPGNYEVLLAKRGFAPRWYGGDGAEGESRGSADVAPLADGGTTDLGVVTLAPGGILRGTVRMGGVGTSSVRFYVSKLVDGSWVREYTTTPGAASGYTSTNGVFSYSLSTLLPVKVSALIGPSSGKQFRYYYGDAYSSETATAITVESGATRTGIDLDAPAVASLGGRLTNSFGGNLGGSVTVHVRDHGQVVPLQYEGVSTFNPSATSTFNAVVPANTPLTYSGSSSGFETAYLGDVAEPEQATFRSVLPGGTLNGLSVALPGGRAFRARLVESTWNGSQRLPVSGIEVTAWWNDTLMSRGVTDTGGYVRLPGFAWGASPFDIAIHVSGPGIEPGWFRGWGEVVADRAAASTYVPPSTGDNNLGEYPVAFADGVQLTPASEMSPVNQVAGEPLTVQLPEWSTTPDQVVVTVGDGWPVATITDDFSRIVEIPWYGDWSSATVRAVATKAGFQSGTALTGITRIPFSAIQPPRIVGTALPGRTLTFEPAQFNAAPTSIQPAWQRAGAYPVRGDSYEVTNWDVGHTVRLSIDARYGTAWAHTRAPAVRVQARSTLKTTARATGSGTRIAVSLATPGVLQPGGAVTVRSKGDVLARIRITNAPVTKRLLLRSKIRSRTVQVVYSGARWASPASRTVAVHR